MKLKNSMLALAIAALPTVSAAQVNRIGDWQVDLHLNATMTGAYTTNESGSIFGFICTATANRCLYYLAAQTTCDPNSTSTILVNTDSGALMSSITCTKVGSGYFNTIDNTKDMNNAIASSSNLGIALPMQSGEFKVVRFSLTGAVAATSAAAAKVVEMEKNVDHMQ